MKFILKADFEFEANDIKDALLLLQDHIMRKYHNYKPVLVGKGKIHIEPKWENYYDYCQHRKFKD